MIIFLFGPTGSGKNYIGEILASEFDFFFLDADDLFSTEAMKIIKSGGVISQKMRDQFFVSIINQTQKLQKKHQNLAVAQAFIKDINRLQLKKEFPNSAWIYVEADSKIRYKRLNQRKHFASSSYAQKMDKVYEPPSFDHIKVNNDQGQKHIKKQLKEALPLT